MRTIFALALLCTLALARPVFAADTCDGPPECCVPHAVHGPVAHQVALGVVLMGLANLNERAGTWDADYYLYEEWTPAAGFTPQTEIVNEVSRQNALYDSTALRDGKCLRSRRLRSTLRTAYSLRTFPFDYQDLKLVVSDDEFPASELAYADHPYALGLDDEARKTLSSWKIDSDPSFAHAARVFEWERGAPAYDNGTVEFSVRRHVTFHLFKYFLPLFIIVALAFSVFWLDADELGSAATIGVTSLLAAIAFQFAEASALPEVSYLTLADRVYIVCYVAIAAALIETIYTNRLARRGDKDRAAKYDRRSRVVFPVVLVVALAASVVRAFTDS